MDDVKPQQAISDDQELAKVLAGVSQQADDAVVDTPAPVIPPVMPPVPPVAVEPAAPQEPTPAVMPPTPSTTHHSAAPSGGSELDSIKLEALNELRPLVDKLDVPADEKFDTYLLLLRSTDDKALIAPAHEAAKAIADEARRAQALLDIIKEIDFLSQGQK